MIGWLRRLNGHEFEQTLGDGEGQRSLACCSPWVTKSRTQLSDTTTKFSLQDTNIAPRESMPLRNS